jgi:hypothetical protein
MQQLREVCGLQQTLTLADALLTLKVGLHVWSQTLGHFMSVSCLLPALPCTCLQELMLVATGNGAVVHVTQKMAALLGRSVQQVVANGSAHALHSLMVEPFSQMHRTLAQVGSWMHTSDSLPAHACNLCLPSSSKLYTLLLLALLTLACSSDCMGAGSAPYRPPTPQLPLRVVHPSKSAEPSGQGAASARAHVPQEAAASAGGGGGARDVL